VRIEGIIWIEEIAEKLASKHHVSTDEVEDLLAARSRFRFVERGHRPGENVYTASGRTRGGRRLLVFFIHKPRTHEALILSAREPSQRERKLYEKK
jgi:uncharacterized DUF497 family protein